MERPRTAPDEQAAARGLDAVRRARLKRLRALSPSQRVERLHALCAQVAAFRAPRDDGRS